MIPWSRIQRTELARQARHYIVYHTHEDWIDPDSTMILQYHNLNHVISMYQYLADTNEPYDEAVDWAVLFHDIIFDELPEKELRSAEKFRDMAMEFDGCTLDIWERERVCQLILDTSHHIVNKYRKGSSAIIRADLHQLANPEQTIRNYLKIMDESKKLYGISSEVFAENNVGFMDGLYARVEANLGLDSEHHKLYEDILDGIENTIAMSHMIVQG